MKLLLCTQCQDIIRLIETKRVCECGETGGRYLDYLNAVYFGKHALPLGFANPSLAAATLQQPEEGMGKLFTAFVIPKICPTYKLVEEAEV